MTVSLCRIPDYAESECDAWSGGLWNRSLIEVGLENDAAWSASRGILPKAEVRTFSLSAAVDTVLHTRVKVSCLPGFRRTCSIVLGSGQFIRIGRPSPVAGPAWPRLCRIARCPTPYGRVRNVVDPA